EVEVAVVVDVAEVTAPIPAKAGGPLVGLGVAVVALEGPHPGGVDDLAHTLLGVDEPAGRVEAGPRKLASLLVHDLHRLAHESHGPSRHLVAALHGDAALGGAEGVDDL